jgi:hypothetical protein
MTLPTPQPTTTPPQADDATTALIPLIGPLSGHLRGELDPVRCVVVFKRKVHGRMVAEEVDIGAYVRPLIAERGS